MAQIYVNNGLVKPKSIHIYNSLAQLWEENRIGYVRINGEWVPFIQYMQKIYELGTEFLPIVQGYAFGVNMSKQADHILLNSAVGSGDRSVSCVTDIMVDLTNFSNIFIDWEYSVPTLWGSRAVHLVASNIKGGHHNNFNAKLSKTPALSVVRETVSLDVSALNGDFYISSHSLTSNLKVYRIWLE